MSNSIPSVKIYHVGDASSKSSLWTIDNWLDIATSDALLTTWSNIDAPLITEPKFNMFGKNCTMWRRMGFFSNVSGGYSFARQKLPAQPITPDLANILVELNATCGTNFNGLLCNDYRTGNDYVSPHSDAIAHLSRGIVGALSIGSERWFVVYDITTKKEICRVQTHHGQLLVMSGDFQVDYMHGIPIEQNCDTPRVSFTGREHKK